MQQIRIAMIVSFVVTIASCCLSGNDTINTTEFETSLLSFNFGSSNFALEMFRTLHNGSSVPTNLFFSPISVWLSLTTIYIGSRHQTAKELATVLGLSDIDLSSLPSILTTFLETCDSCKEDHKSILNLANRIYFQKDLNLEFCDLQLKKIFYRIDFRSDPEKARAIINDFIKNETNGKIEELIPPHSVGSLTQMIIANAVYFKGIWKNQFNRTMTRFHRFHSDKETVLAVAMMNTIGIYTYGVSNQMDCQALEIPYEGESTTMLILLPKHSFRGLNILAKTLTMGRLESLLNSMTSQDVLITLPKFKVEQQYELSRTLQNIGLRSLFDARFSDLSGFTENNKLSIDAIHHKSYIKVNEDGTEAAAATGALFSRDSHPLGITRFYADRPFMYFIRDSYSKLILFVGTVRIPQYNE